MTASRSVGLRFRVVVAPRERSGDGGDDCLPPVTPASFDGDDVDVAVSAGHVDAHVIVVASQHQV